MKKFIVTGSAYKCPQKAEIIMEQKRMKLNPKLLIAKLEDEQISVFVFGDFKRAGFINYIRNDINEVENLKHYIKACGFVKLEVSNVELTSYEVKINN